MISRITSNGVLPVRPAPTSLIRDLFRAFFRHKGKMVLVFIGTSALLATGFVICPRTYTSEARLFIRIGKESVGLDPTATMSEVINVHESRENEINSELEILKSRVVLEDVVARMGADRILSRGPNTNDAWPALDAAKSWLLGEVSLADKAIRQLEKAITVSSPRKSNVLLVKCKASSPEKAQQTLQAFLDSYAVYHVRANRTAGSHDFFASQAELLRVQLADVEGQLRQAKNQNNIASSDGQRTNLEDQANTVEVAILENQRLLAAGEERLTELKKLLVNLPQHELAEEATIPSEGFEVMRGELYKVQIKEKAASSRFTKNHPQVIAARKQVADMREVLATEEASRNLPTHKASVVHQTVHTDLASTQADVAARKAQSQSLQNQLRDVRERIRSLNDEDLRIQALMREAELLEASYRTYNTNREQSRIDTALETGRISNINVVQPPSLVTVPSSPSMSLAAALTFVMGSLAAVFVAVLSEHLDQSLRSPELTEQLLGVPVLFAVPRGSQHGLIKT